MPPKEEQVTVPRWFVQFVAWGIGFVVLLAGGAVPWAWSIDRNVTQIRSNLEAIDKVHAIEMLELKRRVDRHDEQIELLRSKR